MPFIWLLKKYVNDNVHYWNDLLTLSVNILQVWEIPNKYMKSLNDGQKNIHE